MEKNIKEIQEKNRNIAFIIYTDDMQKPILVKSDEMDYDKLARDFNENKVYDCFSFDHDFSDRIKAELMKRDVKLFHYKAPAPICPDCNIKLIEEKEQELEY